MLSRWQSTSTSNHVVSGLQLEAAQLMLHTASEILFGRECRWDFARSGRHVEKLEQRPMEYDSAIKWMGQSFYLIFFVPRLLPSQ